MQRKLILLSTTLASVAHAQVVQPLAYPHNQHAICHEPEKLWYQSAAVRDNCKQIRDKETVDYKAYTSSATQQSIVHEDPTQNGKIVRDTGRRNTYDQSKVTGWTWEPTFAAKSWLKRFTPNYFNNSAHPEWENATVDDCDEYAYKRFYGPHRYLDLLNGVFARRGYLAAVGLILSGLPAYGSAKAVAALPNNWLRDYDGYAIRAWSPHFTGAYLPIMTPRQTGSQLRNPFYGMPVQVKDTTGAGHDSQWMNDLQWAWLVSNNNATVTYPSNGEWGYASTMRSHGDVASLSASEADAVASRVDAMQKARQTALHSFNQCVNERWVQKSLSSGAIDYKSSSTFREFAEASKWDFGATDPLPYAESQLLAQLLDPNAYQTTISRVASADINGTDEYAAYARTPTGTMLRSLSTANSSELPSSVSETQAYVKGGGEGPCSRVGADFELVRELLVDEYRRGAEGCMSASKRCDFVPKLFVRDTIDRLNTVVADADAAKQYCVTAVGAFDGGTSPVPPEKRNRIADLESYMKAEVAKVQDLLENLPRKSTLPRSIGDRVDGGSTWGDPSSFGAGYSYNGEWGINSVRDQEPGHPLQGEACMLGGRANGHLDAYVTAFGIRQELVDVSLYATTTQKDTPSSYFANVEIAGEIIFTESQQNIPQTYEDEDKHGWEIPIVKTTILVGPIPVSLEVNVGFEYGYRLELGFTQVSTCGDLDTSKTPSLSLDGTVTPFAGANASVSAYVDLFIVGAGIKGKLTLVEARLPYDTDISVRRHTSDNQYYVHANSSLKLVLQELSGGFYFILKVVGITVLEHEIFSWPGIRQEVTIWEDSAQFPIRGFQLVN